MVSMIRRWHGVGFHGMAAASINGSMMTAGSDLDSFFLI
jgi:hypothetical protein